MGDFLCPWRLVPERLSIIAAIACSLVFSESLRSAEPATPFTERLKQIEPAVAQVETDKAVGSGFLAIDTLTIVTNYHVIEGASWRAHGLFQR